MTDETFQKGCFRGRGEIITLDAEIAECSKEPRNPKIPYYKSGG